MPRVIGLYYHEQPITGKHMFDEAKTKVDFQLKSILKLRATLDETEARINEAAAQSARLDSLKRTRARAIAEATLDGVEPKLGEIDAEIAALEKTVSDGADALLIDQESRDLLAGRLTTANEKLAKLREAARAAALDEMRAGQDAAVARYHETLNQLRDTIAEICSYSFAAEKAFKHENRAIFDAHMSGILRGSSITEYSHNIGIVPQYRPVIWCAAGGSRTVPGTPVIGQPEGAEMAARFAVP